MMAHEKEMWEKQAAYNLEIAKIETRWNALFRLPTLIIRLPVYCLMALAYIAHAIKGSQPSEKFWEFLHK